MTTTVKPGAIIRQDPEALLDYSFDWTDWLEVGDTIASKVVAGGGLTVTTESFTDTNVIFWLSAGVVGTRYRVECKITTAAGRTDERSFYVMVEEL